MGGRSGGGGGSSTQNVTSTVTQTDLPKEFSSDHKLYYRGELPRGSIPEPFWFLREAVKILTEGQFDSVGRFEDDPLTGHEDVVMVMDVAIDLVRLEMQLAANLQPTYH